uniref:Homing endonuclease n=1 Tax=viral metagenome TaxID=1070528 RepID=A0A6M3IK53_9ZZZZ
MKELTDTECAYLTGIIEGEGCIRIDNVAPGKGKPKSGWRPTVHVTQKGRQLIDELNSIYPGQIIESHGPKHLKNFRIAWVWGRCYDLMKQILPYMKGPKKKQVELVLNFHKHIQEMESKNYISEEEKEWRQIQLHILGYLKRQCE